MGKNMRRCCNFTAPPRFYVFEFFGSHQTHTPDNTKRGQCHQCVDRDAVEHRRKSGFAEIGDAGSKTDGGQSADPQELAGAFHCAGNCRGDQTGAIDEREQQKTTNKPGNDLLSYLNTPQ